MLDYKIRRRIRTKDTSSRSGFKPEFVFKVLSARIAINGLQNMVCLKQVDHTSHGPIISFVRVLRDKNKFCDGTSNSVQAI